jgi:adenine C2-methylase RlmN of 23S rRNA A2503 and tRNA A37
MHTVSTQKKLVSRSNIRYKELPGGSPAMLPWLLNQSVFLSLGDMGFPLPDYTEIPVSVPLASEQATLYEELKEQLKNELKERLILTHDSGLAIGPRYITLSTVGLPQAIRRLADEQRPINLAVRLHAATDAERTALVPINKRWSLAQLIDACRYYIEVRRRRIFFEWALIAGENDTAEQAHAVGRLLQGLDAHVNLIPLNPTTGYEGTPTDPVAAAQFQEILASYNLPSTIRQRRGIDIDAGCGQLRARVN